MSNGFLLDVNVLIAAIWPTHESHSTVQRWLRRHVRDGWATCPLTQAAFVRIVSNPAFSPNALTPRDALALLEANLRHAAHHFWEDEISFLAAAEPLAERLVGHQQVSDAYLLGLAIYKKGKLASLDKGVLALLPAESAHRGSVVLI
jgi:uncharacterized protein